jgi:hypothetical protein
MTCSHQHRNVLFLNSKNVPIHEIGHYKRKYITEEKIQGLAFEIFTSSGNGLTFKNIMSRFSVGKAKAQLCLKNFSRKGTLFTANYLRRQGIFFISNTKPQQYFSMRDRSHILENLKRRKGNIPVEPTGVHQSTPSLLSQSKSSLPYTIKYQTEKAHSFLEVLMLLPFTPPYIHKVQLLSHIPSEYYSDLDKKQNIVNNAKIDEEVIGRRHATYTYSSNGTVEVAIRSNDTPFRIATDEDVSYIFSVLGQLRDRLLFHVSDPKERAVPSIMEWTLKACDLNKDILISDKAQLTLPDIQLKHADRVFRLYVKLIENEAYYRSEESLTSNQILPEALDNIRYPYKSVDKKLDNLSKMVNRLNNSVIRINCSTIKPTVHNRLSSRCLSNDGRWV